MELRIRCRGEIDYEFRTSRAMSSCEDGDGEMEMKMEHSLWAFVKKHSEVHDFWRF